MTVRPLSLLALAGAITLGLAGCAGAPGDSDSVTIDFEIDGAQQSVTFTPGNLVCHDFGVRGLSYPAEPFNSVAIVRGSSDEVSAWVYDEQLIYFEGDDATVTENSTDDGATEYLVSAASGRVAVTSLGEASADAEPDVAAAIEDAEWVTGAIDVRLHCPATP
ncbi:hypothetical protein [Microbacterium sp. P05]|uniref:hypothetical protein n=1 Tax=Microbacterium sp. P05 TaxID=3366948 RepID=UPI003746330D